MRVQITEKHRGKLTGLSSINTSTVNNPYCQKMSKNSNCICSKCYAFEIESVFEYVHNFQAKNYEIINNHIIEPNTFRKVRPVRFNSIGELGSALHLENLIRIVNHNSHIQFSLWTKRIDITNKVFKTIEKPKNLILIYSSPVINKCRDIKTLKYFDKVFTVYSYEYTKKNNININCGGKHCIECLTCYSVNDTVYVNEHIKRSISTVGRIE
jgi:hypothetical protein